MLDSSGLLAFTWILLVFAWVLALGRLWLRRRYFNDFYADDYIHIVASVSSFAFAVAFSVHVNRAASLQSPQTSNGSSTIEASRVRDAALAQIFFFWLTIYLVKFVFLVRYPRPEAGWRLSNVLWSVMIVVCAVFFWITLGLDVSGCEPPGDNYNADGCASQTFRSRGIAASWASAVLNCLSNVAIALFPLWQLRGNRPRGYMRLAVFLMGLLAIILTILGFVRVALASHTQSSWKTFGDTSVCIALELILAILLSALVVYGPLVAELEGKGRSRERLSSGAYVEQAPPTTSPQYPQHQQQAIKHSESSVQRSHPSRHAPRALPQPLPRLQVDFEGTDREVAESQRTEDPLHTQVEQQQQQRFQDQLDFIQSASPVERRFYRLWLSYMDRQSKSMQDTGKEAVVIAQDSPTETGPEVGVAAAAATAAAATITTAGSPIEPEPAATTLSSTSSSASSSASASALASASASASAIVPAPTAQHQSWE